MRAWGDYWNKQGKLKRIHIALVSGWAAAPITSSAGTHRPPCVGYPAPAHVLRQSVLGRLGGIFRRGGHADAPVRPRQLGPPPLSGDRGAPLEAVRTLRPGASRMVRAELAGCRKGPWRMVAESLNSVLTMAYWNAPGLARLLTLYDATRLRWQ